MTTNLIFSCGLVPKSSLAQYLNQLERTNLLMIFQGHGQPALMKRSVEADGEKLGLFLPISYLFCQQTALVSKIAHPPCLSPAVLKELWCCCEAVTNDQFKAVMAE